MLYLFPQLVGSGKQFEAVAFLEEGVVWGVGVHPNKKGKVELAGDFKCPEVQSSAFLAVVGRVLADAFHGAWGEDDVGGWLLLSILGSVAGRTDDFEGGVGATSYANVGAFEET